MSPVAEVSRSRHTHQSHIGWDNQLAPVLTVKPGETVEFHPLEASGGQITASSTVADIARLDFAKVNPVTGPVYIDGAQPGDAVKVTLLSLAASGWGWTANIPGFGLLADLSGTRPPGPYIASVSDAASYFQMCSAASAKWVVSFYFPRVVFE